MTEAGELAAGASSALWLGLLTSMSPCPLATNIAAVSYLARRVDRPAISVAGGLLYCTGRTVAYVALAALLVTGLLSAPGLSQLLQRTMNRILGPVLILAGLVLFEIIRVPLPGLGRRGEAVREKLHGLGLWGALPLGALFALSFCPVSAALFFGSLLPLAVRFESPALFPTLYGIGTALPVVAVAILMAAGARVVGKVFNRLAQVERIARWSTGLVFVLIGAYMTIVYTLGFSI